MKNDDVLSLDSRRRIHDFVRRNPGAHLREIARSLELPLGTALYHLDYLSQTDMVVVRRDGRYKRFFVKHMLGRLEKDYVSAFHHAVPRKIVTILLTQGKCTQRELCEAVGVSRSTLSFHVNNLVEKGILKCDYRWPENHYSVADPTVASKVLVQFRETFWDGVSDRFDSLVNAIESSLIAQSQAENERLAVAATAGAPPVPAATARENGTETSPAWSE
jgi:DNA-binding MarR family transcriptional regulator